MLSIKQNGIKINELVDFSTITINKTLSSYSTCSFSITTDVRDVFKTTDEISIIFYNKEIQKNIILFHGNIHSINLKKAGIEEYYTCTCYDRGYRLQEIISNYFVVRAGETYGQLIQQILKDNIWNIEYDDTDTLSINAEGFVVRYRNVFDLLAELRGFSGAEWYILNYYEDEVVKSKLKIVTGLENTTYSQSNAYVKLPFDIIQKSLTTNEISGDKITSVIATGGLQKAETETTQVFTYISSQNVYPITEVFYEKPVVKKGSIVQTVGTNGDNPLNYDVIWNKNDKTLHITSTQTAGTVYTVTGFPQLIVRGRYDLPNTTKYSIVEVKNDSVLTKTEAQNYAKLKLELLNRITIEGSFVVYPVLNSDGNASNNYEIQLGGKYYIYKQDYLSIYQKVIIPDNINFKIISEDLYVSTVNFTDNIKQDLVPDLAIRLWQQNLMNDFEGTELSIQTLHNASEIISLIEENVKHTKQFEAVLGNSTPVDSGTKRKYPFIIGYSKLG